MKNPINKKNKNSKYHLQNSNKSINKHSSDTSISLSGELTFNNAILVQRQFYNSGFEMF